MKRLGLCLVALLLIVLSVAPAFAVAPADLNRLAQYFPEDAPVFMSFRTDDGYIEALDALVIRIRDSFPELAENMDGPRSLGEALDTVVKEIIGSGGFESEVRTWLGDVGSVGINSLAPVLDQDEDNDDEVPFVIAAEVTDRAAAEAFFTAAIEEQGDIPIAEEDAGFTIYTDDVGDGALAIGDEVLFLARTVEDLPIKGTLNPLSESAAFSEALALLPESDYNITAVLNFGDFMQAIINDMPEFQAEQLGAFAGMLENYPIITLGATILDDRSLTIDTAIPVDDMMAAMEEAGLPSNITGPVDPEFVARIPAGAPIVLHLTDLQAYYNNALASFRIQAEMGAAGGILMEDLEKGLSQFEFAIQGVTGLSWEDDILPALNGDFAMFVAVDPALGEAESMMEIFGQESIAEVGIVAEVSNPEVITGIINGVAQVLESNNDVETELEERDGTLMLTIRPDTSSTGFPVELMLAGNDEVLYFGTANSAANALNPDGGLSSDAAYQEAQGYELPDTVYLFYLAAEGLRPLINIAEMQGGSSSEQDAANLEALLNLLNSSTITANYEDGINRTRMVITLSEG
jgi:hypothetical protein